MELETYKNKHPKGCHIRKYESIPTHKHHVSITFQDVIPREKSFATYRVSFASNYVSNQKMMNFEKLREIFVHNSPRNKIFLPFLHRCYGFG